LRVYSRLGGLNIFTAKFKNYNRIHVPYRIFFIIECIFIIFPVAITSIYIATKTNQHTNLWFAAFENLFITFVAFVLKIIDFNLNSKMGANFYSKNIPLPDDSNKKNNHTNTECNSRNITSRMLKKIDLTQDVNNSTKRSKLSLIENKSRNLTTGLFEASFKPNFEKISVKANKDQNYDTSEDIYRIDNYRENNLRYFSDKILNDQKADLCDEFSSKFFFNSNTSINISIDNSMIFNNVDTSNVSINYDDHVTRPRINKINNLNIHKPNIVNRIYSEIKDIIGKISPLKKAQSCLNKASKNKLFDATLEKDVSEFKINTSK
jgi:hypothetical protein